MIMLGCWNIGMLEFRDAGMEEMLHDLRLTPVN